MCLYNKQMHNGYIALNTRICKIYDDVLSCSPNPSTSGIWGVVIG